MKAKSCSLIFWLSFVSVFSHLLYSVFHVLREPLSPHQTFVFVNKLLVAVMDGEALFPDSDDLEHAQIFELIQHQLGVVAVRRLGHVGLDAAHIP